MNRKELGIEIIVWVGFGLITFGVLTQFGTAAGAVIAGMILVLYAASMALERVTDS